MADADLTVGDVIEVRFEGLIGSERWNNVRHFAITTAPSNPAEIYENLEEMAQILHDAYWNALKDYLSQNWTHTVTRCKRIRPGPSVFALHANERVGVVTADVDEPDDALVARFYTSQAGKSHQGRMYIAGIPDDDVVNGVYDSSKALLMRADLIDLFSNYKTFDNGMIGHAYVWSKKLSDDGDPLTQAAWPITQIVIDRVMRRQTRRELQGPILTGA